MEPKAETLRMQESAHRQFWSGVPTTNGLHDPPALFRGTRISHRIRAARKRDRKGNYSR